MMLINNFNYFLNILQDVNLTFEQILTILSIVGGGVAAVWAWFAGRDKQKLQAKITAAQKRVETELELVKKQKELELKRAASQHILDIEIAKERIKSELEDARDNREFRQEQNRLEIAYQQSEMSIAHRLTAELLDKLIEFTTKEVSENLDLIKNNSSRLPDMSKRMGEIEEQTRNLVTYYKILTGLLDDFHKKYERDRGTKSD